MAKFFNYLTWTICVLLVLGVIWLIVAPIVWWTPLSEWRLYIRIFLLMFAVSTFALLRLYNSIVQNTRFSIKLREAFGKFLTIVPALERAMKNLNSSLGNARSATDTLTKRTSDNTDSIQELTKRLRK